MTEDANPTKLSDSIARLIDQITLMEIDEVKNLMWKAIAQHAISRDPFLVNEFDSDSREMAKIFEGGKRWSPGVVQDAMTEFLVELRKVRDGS